jgi:hypothetical protein
MRSSLRGYVLSSALSYHLTTHALILTDTRILFISTIVILLSYHVPAMFIPYVLDHERLQYLRSPQGKVAELRLELNSGGKKDKNFSAKKTALKKIVANMTMSNNDMVALFPDIVGCMHIQSLEIKKMYAYPI